MSNSDSFIVFSINNKLSEKKKNEGDLPSPVLKLYIPVMFLFGVKDKRSYYSVILPYLKLLNILGAYSVTLIADAVSSL